MIYCIYNMLYVKSTEKLERGTRVGEGRQWTLPLKSTLVKEEAVIRSPRDGRWEPPSNANEWRMHSVRQQGLVGTMAE